MIITDEGRERDAKKPEQSDITATDFPMAVVPSISMVGPWWRERLQ